MMDPSTLRALLPCHICGDLPPEVAAQVEAALRADPSLAQEAAFLRSSREACLDALSRVDDFPELPSFDDSMTPIPVLHLEREDLAETVRPPRRSPVAVAPPVRARTGWRGLVFGAAAAALLLGGMLVSPTTGPEDAVFARHEAIASGSAALQPGSESAGLAASLRRAGVPPALVRVPDLSEMGLEIVGGTAGLVDGRLGSTVVYEKDGQRFICEFAAHMDRGGEVVASKRVGGVDLWAYERDGRAVVVWRDRGLYCVFSGPMGAEEMLAMVSMRMETTRARG